MFPLIYLMSGTVILLVLARAAVKMGSGLLVNTANLTFLLTKSCKVLDNEIQFFIYVKINLYFGNCQALVPSPIL